MHMRTQQAAVVLAAVAAVTACRLIQTTSAAVAVAEEVVDRWAVSQLAFWTVTTALMTTL